jgi:hypothetical protein
MLSNIIMTVKGTVLLLLAVHFFAALLPKKDADWVKGSPRTIFLSFFLIGMWCHFVWVMYLLILVTIAVLPRSRSEAAALYTIAIVATPTLSIPISLGSMYLLPFTKYLFATLGLLIAFSRLKSAKNISSRFDIPIIIVIILEIAKARDPVFNNTMRGVLPVMFAIAMPYFLVSRSLNSPEDLRRFLLAIVFSGFVLAIVATIEVRLHWLMYKQIEDNLGISARINAYSKMRGGMLRAPATFPESLALGNYLVLAGVALLALRTSFATKQKFYIALTVIGVGLLAPNSRGALVGFGIGLLAYDVYRRRYGALTVKLVVGGLLYTTLQMLAQFSTYFASLAGQGSGEQASSDYRVLLLHRGLEEIRKHPMIGVNMGQAVKNLSDLTQGEGIVDLVNGYITYGLILGYSGIVGILLVFVSLCGGMIAIRKRLRDNDMLLDIGAFAFAIATLTIAQTFYVGFGGDGSAPFYETCALAASLYGLSRTSLARYTAGGTQVPIDPGNRPAIWATIAAARANAQARSAQLRDRSTA